MGMYSNDELDNLAREAQEDSFDEPEQPLSIRDELFMLMHAPVSDGEQVLDGDQQQLEDAVKNLDQAAAEQLLEQEPDYEQDEKY